MHAPESDAMFKTFRIGQIVPSSNTTMETEVPAMLRAREVIQESVPQEAPRTV